MSIRQWFDHALSDAVSPYISGALRGYELEASLIAIATPVLGYLAVKALRGVFSPASEPDWRALHPDNENLMQQGFNDLHTVVSLAKLLNENDAQTLDELRAQIRRLGLYSS